MSRVTLALCPDSLHGPPRAQSPFAHRGCYLRCRAVSPHVSRHYPTFIAPTGSCAHPTPASCLGITLVHQVFAGCCQPRLGVGPSRRSLCDSFSTCLDPYPGGSWGALTRFFPHDNGLPDVRARSAPGHFPHSNFRAELVFGAAAIRSSSGPPIGSPSRLLLPQRLLTLGSHGFSVHASLGLLPPRAGDMLTVRFGQLTVRRLSLL